VKAEDSEPPDDLRVLEFKKNQYGPLGTSITLRYQSGLFLPEAAISNSDALTRSAKAQDVFLELLRRFDRENRNFSDKKTAPNYAPTAMSKEDEARNARVTREDLRQAMLDLFKAETITNLPYGRGDRSSCKIVIKG
jgi:RecA-family ATPase